MSLKLYQLIMILFQTEFQLHEDRVLETSPELVPPDDWRTWRRWKALVESSITVSGEVTLRAGGSRPRRSRQQQGWSSPQTASTRSSLMKMNQPLQSSSESLICWRPQLYVTTELSSTWRESALALSDGRQCFIVGLTHTTFIRRTVHKPNCCWWLFQIIE